MPKQRGTRLPPTHIDDLAGPRITTNDASVFKMYKLTRHLRKTYKSMPRSRQAVWPEALELVLIAALKAYRPLSRSRLLARSPSSLLRFPGRNKFISTMISKMTGIKRTPKQVGSRLQQLRETTRDAELLKLLTCKEFPPEPFSQCSSVTDESPPTRSPSPAVTHVSTALSSAFALSDPSLPDCEEAPIVSASPPFVVDVALCLEGPSASRSSDIILDLNECTTTNPFEYGNAHVPLIYRSIGLDEHFPKIYLNFDRLDPTVHYMCTTAVYLDGMLTHQEGTSLRLFVTDQGIAFFQADLVPQHWTNITHIPKDSSRYTIAQTISEVFPSTANPTTISIHYAIDSSNFDPRPWNDLAYHTNQPAFVAQASRSSQFLDYNNASFSTYPSNLSASNLHIDRSYFGSVQSLPIPQHFDGAQFDYMF